MPITLRGPSSEYHYGHYSPDVLLTWVNDPTAPLHPSLYNSTSFFEREAQYTRVWPFPKQAPTGVRTQIYDWGRYGSTLLLRFTANWLTPRAFGSCYVKLPSLPANGALSGLENALTALSQRPLAEQVIGDLVDAPAPSYGRTALAVDGELSLSDTSPTPTDMASIDIPPQTNRNVLAAVTGASQGFHAEGPVWACQPNLSLHFLAAQSPSVGNGLVRESGADVPALGTFVGNSCGALAVVSAPLAADLQALVLIIGGAVIGIVGTFFATKTIQLVGAVRNGRSSAVKE